VETISSGSLGIDLALGWWLQEEELLKYTARILWKTTLTLHAIAEAQKQRNCCFY
jgi:hypothetical protein